MARRRGDPKYLRLWLGDWRQVLVKNGCAAGDRAQLLVITAPGQDGGLRWDTSKCTHGEEVACAGEHGCVVDAGDEWNRTAPARWSALHRAAAARVRRKVGRFRIIERAWEPQKRGVLHQNVMVRATTPREWLAAKLYREALTELAPRYGFGFVSQKCDVREAAHGARYMAKYVSKSADGSKLGIGDVAMRDDCPRIIAWVDPNLTQVTGETIRACRERRTVWRLASRVAAVRPSEGCSLEEARTIRATHRAGKLFHELHARARRARAMGDDWNAEVARRQAEADADARWIIRAMAQLGMEPRDIDDVELGELGAKRLAVERLVGQSEPIEDKRPSGQAAAADAAWRRLREMSE